MTHLDKTTTGTALIFVAMKATPTITTLLIIISNIAPPGAASTIKSILLVDVSN